MPLTLDAVQRAAPDQASLSAAGGLRKASKWPLLAVDVSRALTWGECQGSGSTPYRVVADLDDLGHKCSCPSRKFPCKHVLALLWQYVERPEGFSSGAAPDWVEDWLSRRRKRGTPAPERPQEDKDIASAAAVEAPAPPDPEDAAKKAAAAARRREAREAGVLAGLDELDAWLRDVLADGTGSFPAQAVARTRAIAARMVDARAGGIALELDALPSGLYARPDAERDAWLHSALGRIALLAAAYRRQAHLPAPLVADVRARVGWTLERGDVLDDPTALRVRDRWTVLGVRSGATPDQRLLRHETWLARHTPADATQPRFALLLDFVPVAGASAPPFRPGEGLSAELAYYPSAWPLRALIAQRDPTMEDDDALAPALSAPADGLHAAGRQAASALARHPWLEAVPVVVAGVRVARLRDRFVLADTTPDGAMMPLADAPDATWALAAAGPVTAACLWIDDRLRLLAAHTPWGPWYAP